MAQLLFTAVGVSMQNRTDTRQPPHARPVKNGSSTQPLPDRLSASKKRFQQIDNFRPTANTAQSTDSTVVAIEAALSPFSPCFSCDELLPRADIEHDDEEHRCPPKVLALEDFFGIGVRNAVGYPPPFWTTIVTGVFPLQLCQQ